jgi:uncharacterized protein YdbL (DUF1318 family)
MKYKLLLTGLFCLCLSSPAFAELDLVKAKEMGLIGERQDGLIGMVTKENNDELKSFVEKINKGRLSYYKELSEKYDKSLMSVKLLYGRNLQKATMPGHYFLNHHGRWQKR